VGRNASFVDTCTDQCRKHCAVDCGDDMFLLFVIATSAHPQQLSPDDIPQEKMHKPLQLGMCPVTHSPWHATSRPKVERGRRHGARVRQLRPLRRKSNLIIQ
ncbi:unnamed protein product, partial [Ectocarpus sp. 12 AP-2014]